MLELSGLENNILILLTEKPNITISELSRKTKRSRLIIRQKLKKLNEQLGIKYTIELNERRIGLNFNIVVYVKLKNYSEEIKHELSKSSLPCFAALTKGDFDLVIYVLCRDSKEFDKWEILTRKKLCDYIKDWRSSLVLTWQYGFFPLQKHILEKSNLKPIYKKIAGMLIQNSRISLTYIAKTLGISTPLAKYHLNKLEKEEHFKRALVISKALPERLVIFRRIDIKNNFNEVNDLSRSFLKKNQKNLCFHARLIGSFEHCTFAAFETEQELKHFEKTLFLINKSWIVERKRAIVKKILIGDLNINPFETNKYVPIYQHENP